METSKQLTEEDLEHWVKFDSWTIEQASYLICGLTPVDRESDRTWYESELQPKYGMIRFEEIYHYEIDDVNTEVGKTFQLAGSSVAAGTLTTLENGQVTPEQFLKWASSKDIPVPEQLQLLLGEPKDGELEPIKPSLRDTQRHRERCRALAQLLWEQDRDRTIANLINSDELITYGCEGKIYGEKIVRNWINDLAPNRSPGRRPSKK